MEAQTHIKKITSFVIMIIKFEQINKLVILCTSYRMLLFMYAKIFNEPYVYIINFCVI